MSGIDRRSILGALLAAPGMLYRIQSADEGPQAGIKVPAGKDRFGKARAIGFNVTTFKVATGDTRGALFAMEQDSTKPGGPPLHLHYDQDEFWYVISGEYVFQVGSDRFQAQGGDCLLGPRGLAHAYAYIGPSPGKLLIGFTPAGKMQGYFERPRTPGTYVADKDLYRQYGMELLGPPLTQAK